MRWKMAQTKSLEEMRRDHILLVVRSVRGNIDRASKILGISREELQRRLEEYGLLAVNKSEAP